MLPPPPRPRSHEPSFHLWVTRALSCLQDCFASWRGCSWCPMVLKRVLLRKPLPEHKQLANCYRPLPAPFLFLKKNLFIFGCSGSSLLPGLFSSRSERGPLSSCGVWASDRHGFSCCGAPALGTEASVVEARRPKCSGSGFCGAGLSRPTACRIFLGLGSNPCLLLWQADSLPPRLLPFQHFLMPVSPMECKTLWR